VVTDLRIATRGSALALWQARHVAALLDCETVEVIVRPMGDRDKTTSLSELGGQGIFAKEVQAALVEGRADIAVHAAKDLPASPSQAVPGLVLAAVLARDDPRDVLVGHSLEEMAPGATVATGSPRRRMLVAALRPDLVFRDLRGNVPTRLERIPEGGAVVTAMAALRRLGLEHRVAQAFDPEVFVPQVGQGAIAVECRGDDDAALVALGRMDHVPSRLAVEAERAWLAHVAGHCDVAVAAHAVVDGSEIRLIAAMSDQHGGIIRDHKTGSVPRNVGVELAEAMLAVAARVRR